MINGTEKYIGTVNYLSRLYDFCNEKLFGGELIKPVITVQRDERNKVFGWWSKKKVWHESGENEGDGSHELNIVAQECAISMRTFITCKIRRVRAIITIRYSSG